MIVPDRRRRKIVIVPSALAWQHGAQGWVMALTSLRVRVQVIVYRLALPSPDSPRAHGRTAMRSSQRSWEAKCPIRYSDGPEVVGYIPHHWMSFSAAGYPSESP